MYYVITRQLRRSNERGARFKLLTGVTIYYSRGCLSPLFSQLSSRHCFRPFVGKGIITPSTSPDSN